MKGRTKIALGVSLLGATSLVAYLLSRQPVVAGMNVNFAGYSVEKIGENGNTTTRQSTGETATEFRFYPLLNVIPDINGAYNVSWMWSVYIDGYPRGHSGPVGGSPLIGDIINNFSGVVGGIPVQFTLQDNRDPITSGRDPSKNGAVTIGDEAFAYLGIQDGTWHVFRTECSAKIVSPSGASVTVNGYLQDNFKSVGSLSATFAGYAQNLV